MPCATEIVRYGEEKAKLLAKIPMSNDTVKGRISSVTMTSPYNWFTCAMKEKKKKRKMRELFVLQRA